MYGTFDPVWLISSLNTALLTTVCIVEDATSRSLSQVVLNNEATNE